MRKIGAALLTPNQITASGIQASGEIGRSIWISGLIARASGAIPAEEEAERDAEDDGRAVAGEDAHERVGDVVPEEALLRERRRWLCATAERRGEDLRAGRFHGDRPDARGCAAAMIERCHAQRRKATRSESFVSSASLRSINVFIPGAPVRSRRRSDRATRCSAASDRSRGCGMSMSTTRRMRARPRAHDHDAVGELHRLLDVVRDEEDRLLARRCQMRSSSLRICRRVIESSAPNGSSRKRTSGFTASARATSTRCFMPPESSRGYDFSKPSRPTSSM